MIKEYIICVETYSEENTEGPILVNGALQDVVTGHKLFVIKCKSEDASEIAKGTILSCLATPEFVKATFPKFYKLSLTKQYWFHVFEPDFIAKNQRVEPELNEKEITLEDHLEQEKTYDGGLIDSIDIYFDRDLNQLNGPPERINFWEMLGLEDLGD